MKETLLQKITPPGPLLEIDPEVATRLLLHSLGVGLLLMVTALFVNLKLRRKTPVAQTAPVPAPGTTPAAAPAEREASPRDTLLGCANVLFLCFAMCGVILLVNNDLARAFALGAAIALVRFRIKLNARTLGSGMLFGIVTGMACGIGQTHLAWGIAAVYSLLQVGLLAVLELFPEEKQNSVKTPPPVLTEPLTAAHGVE